MKCGACEGTGKIDDCGFLRDCSMCDGSGRREDIELRTSDEIQMSIPAPAPRTVREIDLVDIGKYWHVRVFR